jgi:glutamine amidotransferase
MTSGVVNADGFGLGWYHPIADTEPFTYKNILPIWGDINLPELSRYIESNCILANIRSATAGQPTDLSNCQPFKHGQILFTHNGFVENFRQTLYRPIRNQLNDTAYQLIGGSTDSEHIFALFIHHLLDRASKQPKGASIAPLHEMTIALQDTAISLKNLATAHPVKISANLIISNGREIVASRYALNTEPPTLYWIANHPRFPQSIIIASEPLFTGDWHLCQPQSLLAITKNLETHVIPI